MPNETVTVVPSIHGRMEKIPLESRIRGEPVWAGSLMGPDGTEDHGEFTGKKPSDDEPLRRQDGAPVPEDKVERDRVRAHDGAGVIRARMPRAEVSPEAIPARDGVQASGRGPIEQSPIESEMGDEIGESSRLCPSWNGGQRVDASPEQTDGGSGLGHTISLRSTGEPGGGVRGEPVGYIPDNFKEEVGVATPQGVKSSAC